VVDFKVRIVYLSFLSGKTRSSNGEIVNKKTAVVAAALLGTCVQAGAIAQSSSVYMGQIVPYSDLERISSAIQAECQLPQRQAELIVSQANLAGITVVRDDEAVKASKGRILQVEIVNAISMGNAFTGHRKQVHIKGRLLEDGKEIGNFVGVRSSMGGAFAGFKGSCVVLDRCLQTLAADVSRWLKNPVKDSRIGE